MSTTLKLVTAEELFKMSGNQRRELVKGELRIMAPAGFEHGSIIMNLSTPLDHYVRKHKLGIVVAAETGFALERRPDTVRGADVAFIAAARLPAGSRPHGYWEGAPDLAVEVLSPSDTVEEVEEKVDEYLSAGGRMVWVINPKRRTVTVHRPKSNPVVLHEGDSLEGFDVVPGFVLQLAELFA